MGQPDYRLSGHSSVIKNPSMRVFLSILTISVLTACVDFLEQMDRGIAQACGSPDFDYVAMNQRAYEGDITAIDCLITEQYWVNRLNDYIRQIDADIVQSDYEPDWNHAVAFRYLRWIVTGEQPEDIFELAAQANRYDLYYPLISVYTHHALAHGYQTPRLNHGDCFIMPETMNAVWMAAKPHPDIATCEGLIYAFEGH